MPASAAETTPAPAPATSAAPAAPAPAPAPTPQSAAVPQGSLLAGIDPAPAPAANAPGATPANDAAAVKAEKVKNILAKYKTQEDLASAYHDLNAKLSSSRPAGAPEKYEGVLPEKPVFELADDVYDRFKELEMTNDQVKGTLAMLNELAQSEIIPQLKAIEERRVEIEVRDLTQRWGLGSADAAKTRMSEIVTWAQANIGMDEANRVATTANGVVALELQMRADAKRGQTQDGGGAASGLVKEADWMKIKMHPNYLNDEAMQLQVKTLIRRFHQQNPHLQ